MSARILQQYIYNCNKVYEYIPHFEKECVSVRNTCVTSCLNAKNANAIDILYMYTFICEKRTMYHLGKHTIEENFQLINEFEITYC